MLALPDMSVAEPRTTPFEMNDSVPVGVALPELFNTDAVNVTESPAVVAVAELAKLVTVAANGAATAMDTVEDAESAFVLSPEYTAEIEAFPAGRLLVVSVALPDPSSGAVAIITPPANSETVPVGVVEPATVTSKFAGVPLRTVPPGTPNVVVVCALLFKMESR
jgi:hypothetical protein